MSLGPKDLRAMAEGFTDASQWALAHDLLMNAARLHREAGEFAAAGDCYARAADCLHRLGVEVYELAAQVRADAHRRAA